MRGTLIIQLEEVVFAPDNGTWTLEGKLVGTAIQASHSRPSFDHRNYATELNATLGSTHVVGAYTTPTCTYAVDLTKF